MGKNKNGIKVVSFLFFIIGLMLVIFGAYMVNNFVSFLMFFIIVLSIFCFATAYGVFIGKKWGRYLATGFSFLLAMWLLFFIVSDFINGGAYVMSTGDHIYPSLIIVPVILMFLYILFYLQKIRKVFV